jgi:hypothetical protein
VELDAPRIAPSARKHGIPDSDMIHAFNHPIFVDELDDGFTMFVGADPAANLLEIGVVDTTDSSIGSIRRAHPSIRASRLGTGI